MIWSGVNCSVKMSVDERTDIEPKRGSQDTGVEPGIGEEVECGGGGQATGGE